MFILLILLHVRDAGAPQRKLREHDRDEEQPPTTVGRRCRKRSLPSDGDDDYKPPPNSRPTMTVAGDVHSEHPDIADETDTSSESSDSATAVGSDFTNSGGEQDGEHDDDGDIDPMFEQDMTQEKKMWNSPEGWKKFRKYLKKYSQEMSNFGHVCAICGERRHQCVQVTTETLFDWNIAEDYADLLEVLYTQYPQKSHEDGVSDIKRIITICSNLAFGCALDVKLKD